MSAQIGLPEALKIDITDLKECTVQVHPDIGFGSVASGGLMACLIEKYALQYAVQHPRMNRQVAMRSANINFHRPIFPANGPVTMRLTEVSVGKTWSTLRIDVFQGKISQIHISSEVIIFDPEIRSYNISSDWKLLPPPEPVDLSKLERDLDPSWVSYHVPFYPDGFRRSHSYVRFYVPAVRPANVQYVEHWVAPGWDCTPKGSRSPGLPEARWTNETIQFAVDSAMPVQENYLPHCYDRTSLDNKTRGSVKQTSEGSNLRLPLGSIAQTLEFAAAQKKARESSVAAWREVPNDGARVFHAPMLNVTISMSTEMKTPLPQEGCRLLYLRAEVKHIQDGRMDLNVLVFNEQLQLVAISNQVAQLIPASKKESGDAASAAHGDSIYDGHPIVTKCVY